MLRELNARYLHDVNSPRTPNVTNSPVDVNGLSTFLLPPFLRAEHYHQHTHTHEHNLNILTPSNNSLLNGGLNNSIVCVLFVSRLMFQNLKLFNKFYLVRKIIEIRQ